MCLGIIACEGTITKATHESEVTDDHFEYNDFTFEYVGDSLKTHPVTGSIITHYRYVIKGKITNNSGIHLAIARFTCYLHLKGENTSYNIRVFVENFYDAATVEVIREQELSHHVHIDKITIDYEPILVLQ
jgi:hypothetical protein